MVVVAGQEILRSLRTAMVIRHVYMQRRNLARNGEGRGQNRPWVLGTADLRRSQVRKWGRLVSSNH